MQNLKIKKVQNQGFTLIELLVTLAIFVLATGLIVGIFVSAIQAQRKALAIQQTQENLRYVLEMMAKEIRMSEIQSGSDYYYQLQILAYKAEEPVPVSVNYCRANSSGTCDDDNGDYLARNNSIISSAQIKINNLRFVVDKAGHSRVTVILGAESKDWPGLSKMNLQTTLSSREY